jgi:hypothetical protein
LVVVALLLGVPQLAQAQLPTERTIEMLIREDPSDNESEVVFLIAVELSAVSVDNNTVVWDVKGTHFIDKDCLMRPCYEWSCSTPTVCTEDGKWWVEHENPMSPKVEEFDAMPMILGTAAAKGSYDDLDYEVEGKTYGGAPTYGGRVTLLTYSLTLDDDPDPPVEEGDDEPAELDEDEEA